MASNSLLLRTGRQYISCGFEADARIITWRQRSLESFVVFPLASVKYAIIMASGRRERQWPIKLRRPIAGVFGIVVDPFKVRLGECRDRSCCGENITDPMKTTNVCVAARFCSSWRRDESRSFQWPGRQFCSRSGEGSGWHEPHNNATTKPR